MDRMSYRIHVGTEEYLIIGRSMMGRDKIENQDSFSVYYDDSQIVVAMADGLGSAVFSKEGSKKAADFACSILSQIDSLASFPGMLLERWKTSLSGKLALYDTTIKFIKITSEKISFGGIGDGWIALCGAAGYRDVVSNNTFSNQTDSILSFDFAERFINECVSVNDFETILISTDGFSEDIDKDNGKAFLEEVKREIIQSRESFEKDLETTLMDWPVQTNCDDKTVVIIQRG